MTTKQKLLEILEANRGYPISGENLASRLSVSRSAIWKTVKSLQQDGYMINASTNIGYTLDEKSNILSVEGIKQFLNDDKTTIIVEDIIDSTNIYAKNIAEKGAAHGSIVIANQQTQGKGRLGRKFSSPPDSGIYISIILRNVKALNSISLITSGVSVAVCKAIEIISGKSLQIKWVNDLYKGGKKCGGILCEGSTDFETGMFEYIVVGIGINLYEPKGGFEQDISDIATYIFEENEIISRCRLAATIVNEVMKIVDDFPNKSFMNYYHKNNIIIGKEINVTETNAQYLAKAIDITNEGHLLIQLQDERIKELICGEVSIKLNQ
ncbi:MAG: biotin--[acetyl-CoA-carboxylase] ligase [Oscillospiraceae bacterium]